MHWAQEAAQEKTPRKRAAHHQVDQEKMSQKQVAQQEPAREKTPPKWGAERELAQEKTPQKQDAHQEAAGEEANQGQAAREGISQVGVLPEEASQNEPDQEKKRMAPGQRKEAQDQKTEVWYQRKGAQS